MEPVSKWKIPWFGVLALAMPGFYLLLAWRYPIISGLSNPRASWATLAAPSAVNAISHLAIYLGLTVFYLVILRLLSPSGEKGNVAQRKQVPLILITWLACSGVLMFMVPSGESHDIFDYLFRGRLMTEYQANPLVDVPDKYGLSAPYTYYLSWRGNVDTYGPVWEAASYAIASGVRQVALRLGWWNEVNPFCPQSPQSCRLLVLYISAYRLLAISLTGLAGGLIAGIVRRVQPGLVPLALAAWLLNPITLIGSAAGAHNDAIMLVLVLFAWWLLQRQKSYWAMLVIILAGHVKLTAFIWLPACALWIAWRTGWRRALKIGLASAVSGLAISWLLYAPFGGWQSLPRMLHERSVLLTNSFWTILDQMLFELWGWSRENALWLSTGLSNLLFAVGGLLIPLWQFNYRPKRWRSAPIPFEEADSRLWQALAGVSLCYLLVGAFWFQHWYILWLLAPAVLLPGRRFVQCVLPWLAFGALSSNLMMDFLQSTVLQSTSLILVYTLAVVIIWMPAFLATCGFAIVRRRGLVSKKQHH